jgi:hypothetical protein
MSATCSRAIRRNSARRSAALRRSRSIATRSLPRRRTYAASSRVAARQEAPFAHATTRAVSPQRSRWAFYESTPTYGLPSVSPAITLLPARKR